MGGDDVTASGIGDRVYCRRRWWYARRRAPTLASPLLDRGIAAHEVVAGRALRTERPRRVAARLIPVSAASLSLPIGLPPPGIL